MKAGDKVIYTGCTEAQQGWGSNDSPEEKGLVVGNVYEVDSIEVHTWHTKVTIKDVAGRFNSVCFEPFTDERKQA